ncbi:hypothetical protein CSC67_08670 [Pusillimonas caeni]|uniref:hypothetical protein n=1 Tax=Pusillimonas caeni TaxID=1348472 RepID=UPI000E5A08AE|nr:hypothetical protein [Pusillimonas caeni]TFL14215.1 hypothetical protein CSC67_08670 [Pusillimonas caeni]
MPVKVIDHGLDKMVRRADALHGSGVKAGILAGSGSQDGVDMVDIAVYNELGTAKIPARPFMGDAAQKYRRDIGTVMDHLARKVEDGADPDAALQTLGQWYQGRQQAHIRSGEFKPNAPATIKKKGSSVPLVDKGRLVNSVRYEVVKR